MKAYDLGIKAAADDKQKATGFDRFMFKHPYLGREAIAIPGALAGSLVDAISGMGNSGGIGRILGEVAAAQLHGQAKKRLGLQDSNVPFTLRHPYLVGNTLGLGGAGLGATVGGLSGGEEGALYGGLAGGELAATGGAALAHHAAKSKLTAAQRSKLQG